METVVIGIIFIFIAFVFFMLVDITMTIISGILLIIILPFVVLFDGTNIVKKIRAKRTKKVKEDPRDGPTVMRVSKADLRDKPVYRPTVWRQKR